MLNQAPSLNPSAVQQAATQAATAQQANAAPSAHVAGVPAGSHPIPQNVSPAPTPASSASAPTGENLLAAYAKPVDNGTQQPASSAAPAPATQEPAANPMQVPNAKSFEQVAQQAYSTISIDPALQTQALSGDVEAFGQLLNSFGAQLLQQSFHGSAAQASYYTQEGMKMARTDVTEHVSTTQAQQTAESTAIAQMPALATGMNKTLLDTTLKALREQYPTAPAELLGKQAAIQLQGLAPAAAPEEAQATNWAQEFTR